MRVLQVSKFYPPVMGGIEAVAWELTEGLNRAGVRTDVLCSAQAPRGTREQAASGYDICRAGSWGMLLSTSVAPSMPVHLARMAREADIVHLHMPDPMAATALWMMRPEARVVVHWHSDVIRQRLAMRAYAPLQDWLLRRADAVIATSQAYADASPALQPWRSKVHVIPIGICDNVAEVDPLAVAAIRQRVHHRRIVFALGRMTYYKGFDVLIEAASRLPRDVVVLIGGEGDLLDNLKTKAARAGVADRVQFLGHIPDNELANHFAACDVFCLPSTVRAEAYGVAILEAMIMSKPIVASAIEGSGMPWVNQHDVTGLNVPVRESGALAEALNRILVDPALAQRFGQASRSRYVETFSADRMTASSMTLYRSLLGIGPQHG